MRTINRLVGQAKVDQAIILTEVLEEWVQGIASEVEQAGAQRRPAPQSPPAGAAGRGAHGQTTPGGAGRGRMLDPQTKAPPGIPGIPPFIGENRGPAAREAARRLLGARRLGLRIRGGRGLGKSDS